MQRWLGHHSPAFTLAVYVHLLPDDVPAPLDLDTPEGGNKVATGGTSNDTSSTTTDPADAPSLLATPA